MATNRFEQKIRPITGGGLRAEGIDTIQANVGLRCNQRCRHCHVGASPDRTETMDWPTMVQVLDAAKACRCQRLDLTGGAPELNPNFRRFIAAAVKAGLAVQVRTNLTVHLEPGMETLARFLADRGVSLVASLPCYLPDNVDAQRGRHTYTKSIDVLKRLNALGYGVSNDLPLSLVYNPVTPALPPDQGTLEADYRRELADRHGISFTNLLTITNMPIGRYRRMLERQGKFGDYMEMLIAAFNRQTLPSLMCRHQISVGYDGTLYDCDFNLALRVPVDYAAPDCIAEFDARALSERRIVTGDYCFGCTAGYGSSCGGALTG